MNDEQNTLLIQLGVKMDQVNAMIGELNMAVSSVRHSMDNWKTAYDLRVSLLEKWQVKMDTSWRMYAVIFGFILTFVSTIISAVIVRYWFK